MQEDAERLRQHLKKMRLSFNRCARLLNLDTGSVWRYASGRRRPSREVRKRMKRKLGFEWKGGLERGNLQT